MRSRERIKNHPVIILFGLVGAFIYFLVTVIPYITGKQDLPSLLNSASNIDGDKNKEVTLPVTISENNPGNKLDPKPVTKSEKTYNQTQPTPTIVKDTITRNVVDEDKVINKNQEKISKNLVNTKIRYPCSGNIDQIAGIALNHVHVMPSVSSPSQPPVDGASEVKINKVIYRDNKNWYEIKYVTNAQEYSGWLPAIYVVLNSDCYNN